MYEMPSPLSVPMINVLVSPTAIVAEAGLAVTEVLLGKAGVGVGAGAGFIGMKAANFDSLVDHLPNTLRSPFFL